MPLCVIGVIQTQALFGLDAEDTTQIRASLRILQEGVDAYKS